MVFAKELRTRFFKILLAQDKNAEEERLLKSPDILIEPANSLIQKAVQEIRSKKSDYFIGATKIVVTTEPGQTVGHVDNQSPIIHIDLNDITNRVNQAMPSASQQDKDNAIVEEIEKVLTHEKGHLKDLKNGNFPGGETAAETEEKSMIGMLHP